MPRIGTVFGENVTYHDVEVGSTINDFMLAQNPELKNFPVPVVAGKNKPGVTKVESENDIEPVLRKDWNVPLQEGDAIAIVVVPRPKGGGGGGSSNVFSIVLGVIMMVVGVVLMAWSWGASTALVGYGGTMFGLAFGGAMIALGGIIGMMNQPKLPGWAVGAEEASPTYSLNGSGNQARLLQPIPEGFGRIQVTPDVVAQPYYTYENNDQFLYQVFGIGRGTYYVETLSFGEEIFWRDGKIDTSSSLIENASDVTVEIVKPDSSVTLFPDNVESNPNVSRIQLFPINDPSHAGWKGPYVSSPPGTHGTKFQIDFIFSRGVGKYTDKGEVKPLTITLGIRYQKIDDFGNTIGDWITDQYQITGQTLTAQRRSMFIYTQEDSRYQFEFINYTEGSTDTAKPYLDEVYVDGLRCYLPGTLKYTQSVIAIRIKATNVLSSNAQQQFRSIQTRILPVWNNVTKSWSEPVPTRRFDAAIAAMCKAEWGGRLTDNRIDLAALAYCQAKCDEAGWTFDAFIDTAYTVYGLITQSCLPYRVVPRIMGDKISFVVDEKDRPVKHVFTPRDIQRGTLRPKWSTHSDTTPDDMIVSYLDEDVQFARREVQCTLPGSESREPKYLQYPVGVVNRKTAHDYGIYVAACNKYRRLTLEFSVETMGRILYVGDVVSVQHPRLRSAGSGKVVDWDAQAFKIYVDTMPTMDALPVESPNLWMVFTDTSGKPWGPVMLDSFENCCATMNVEDYNRVVQGQVDLFNWINAGYQSQPTTWALQTGKNIDRRYIIQGIQFQDLEHAALTVMNDDPRVFEQNVPLPPWEYRQNNVMWTSLVLPADFSVEYIAQSGVVRCMWSPVVGATAYELQFGPSLTTLQQIPIAMGNTQVDISIERFTYNASHYFRIRSADYSSVSKWKQLVVYIGGFRV